MNNSSMDSTMNNFKTSYSQLEAIMLKPSPSKNSANTSKKDLAIEKCKYDSSCYCLSLCPNLPFSNLPY